LSKLTALEAKWPLSTAIDSGQRAYEQRCRDEFSGIAAGQQLLKVNE
jgi:hypothetical protein